MVAAALGAALTWDGNYFFFEVLDRRAPLVNNERWSNVLVQLPTVALSYLTESIPVLARTFSLSYVAIPLISLVASWLVVQRTQPHLFVWPVLGIGLGTLPGQMCFTCDSIVAVQLFWPVVLSVVVGLRPGTAFLSCALAVLVFFFHPTSSILFAVGGAASLLVWARDTEHRSENLYFSFLLFTLLVVRAIVTMTAATEYEQSQSSVRLFLYYFSEYVWGFPLASLVFAWTAGLLLLLPRFRQLHNALVASARWVRWLSLICVATVGGLLVILALNRQLWMDALSFRQFATLNSVPFLFMLILESRIPLFMADAGPTTLAVWRLPVVNAAGAVFAVVLSLQSVGFWYATNDLRMYLSTSSDACLDRATLTKVHGTALDHWSLPTYAILLQGRTPRTLVLDREGCVAAQGTGPLKLAPFKDYSGGGWFDLQGARSASRQEVPCEFVLSEGWHRLEQAGAGWWRWSPGRGVMRVFVERETPGVLQGQIQSASPLNRVTIVVNGTPQAVIDTGTAMQSFTPVTFHLVAGENILEFVSTNPPRAIAEDPRPLALAVSNLSLLWGGSGQACERPS